MAHTFSKVLRSRKWAREIEQKPERCLAKIFPNPPRHSRRSVSDGVIQLEVLLAGCAGFFLQASIPRRILTKMSGAICCMNMRFAKRSWSIHASKSTSCHSVVRVMRLENSKLCEFSTARSVYYLCIGLLHPFCRRQIRRESMRTCRGGPLWCTRFRRVFRSRKWAREIGQKPGEDVVWQRFSQTRQDTVVGVFPMESSN